MAALTGSKKTRCTQPVSSPTRRRRGPRAGVNSGVRAASAPSDTGGSTASVPRSRAGTSLAASGERRSAPAPLRW